jgi:hypothetical protein
MPLYVYSALYTDNLHFLSLSLSLLYRLINLTNIDLSKFRSDVDHDSDVESDIDIESDDDDESPNKLHSKRDFDVSSLEDYQLTQEDKASMDLFSKAFRSTNTLNDMILSKISNNSLKDQSSSSSSNNDNLVPLSNNIKFGQGFKEDGSIDYAYLSKVKDKQSQDKEDKDDLNSEIDPRVSEVYVKVGQFLAHYTSGKVPKAFKILPNLLSWEQLLLLTNPHSWSPAAYYVATKLFVSAFNSKMTLKYLTSILLPKIRFDLQEHRSLNFNLYQSIKKALYKPAAFFRGIVLTLADPNEGCTLKEATVIASILNKCSIPVTHSAVALHKLAEMQSNENQDNINLDQMDDYSGESGENGQKEGHFLNGPACLFMKSLLSKKYALPTSVIKMLVKFFCSFSLIHSKPSAPNASSLPLIWHQCLLIFVQRYKNNLTINQITALKNLTRIHTHSKISLEVRRELLAVTNTNNGTNNDLSNSLSTLSTPAFSPQSSSFTSLADSFNLNQSSTFDLSAFHSSGM